MKGKICCRNRESERKSNGKKRWLKRRRKRLLTASVVGVESGLVLKSRSDLITRATTHPVKEQTLLPSICNSTVLHVTNSSKT